MDDKGYIDEATAIKATQNSERQPYDVVRQALKEVELDSSRRVELDDYVGVSDIQLVWLNILLSESFALVAVRETTALMHALLSFVCSGTSFTELERFFVWHY